jgi:hypothetical protein
MGNNISRGLMMSKLGKRNIWLLSVIFLLGIGLMVGCSDDDDDTGTGGGTQPVIVTITLGGESMEVNLRDLPSVEFEGMDAVFLYNLISEDLVQPWYDNDSVAWDMRPLHGYRTVGSDGFNPHDDRGYQDLWWDWLSLGYIFVDSRDVMFPDELIDLPGAYDVDDTEEVLVFRMLKVVTPIDSFLVEFDDITPVQVLNPDSVMEDALPLADFIPDTITTLGPENYQYKVSAVDGFTQDDPLNWEQWQMGYWLVDLEKTWFLIDSLQTGRYKIQAASRIEVTQ